MGRNRRPRPWHPARNGRILFIPALVLFGCLFLFIGSQPKSARKVVVAVEADDDGLQQRRGVGAGDAMMEKGAGAVRGGLATAGGPAILGEIQEGRRQKMAQQQAQAAATQASAPEEPAGASQEAAGTPVGPGAPAEVAASPRKWPTKVDVPQDSWTEGWSMRQRDHPPVPWPLYRVGQDLQHNGADKTKHNRWPGAGYRAPGFSEDLDKTFEKVFRFFLLDEGRLDMREAEKCLRKNRGMQDGDSWQGIDAKLEIGEREHLTELFLLRALRTHPLRTRNRDEASLFVIGYAPGLARMSLPCPAYAQEGSVVNINKWEEDVAEALLGDESFNKRGGKDFLFFHSARKWELAKKEDKGGDEDTPPQLADVLDNGPIIATSERYSPNMHMGLPNLFEGGSVIITPHVSSEAIDLGITENEPPIKEEERDGPRFYFRGNMASWHGDRSYMLELAPLLRGADFQEYDFQKHTAEETAPLLEKAAQDMRRAGLCFSPEGDSPASARLFEALGTGCVPIVVSHRHRITFDLPFPSSVDYDAIAVFSEPFRDVASGREGAGMGSLSASLESVLHDGLTERMRHDGYKAFKRFFSYMSSPEGVARGVLMEAWVLLMKHSVLKEKYI